MMSVHALAVSDGGSPGGMASQSLCVAMVCAPQAGSGTSVSALLHTPVEEEEVHTQVVFYRFEHDFVFDSCSCVRRRVGVGCGECGGDSRAGIYSTAWSGTLLYVHFAPLALEEGGGTSGVKECCDRSGCRCKDVGSGWCVAIHLPSGV